MNGKVPISLPSPVRIVVPATGEPTPLALDEVTLWARDDDRTATVRQVVGNLSLVDTFTVTFRDGEEAEALRELLSALEDRIERALGRFQRLGGLGRQGKISIEPRGLAEPRKEEP